MSLFAGTEFYMPPTCDRCEQLEENCQCPPEVAIKEVLPPESQVAIVTVEKRKRGKSVTLISGLKPEDNHLDQLLTQLKNSCGAGGTIKNGRMEIQGSRKTQVQQALRTMGFKVNL
ncbi:MAG: translation initiation factor [Planctomycetota bacterium]